MTEQKNLSPSFIHLHVHSAYSLLEGAITLKDLLQATKKNNMPALALTDTNNLFGALEYALLFSESGIQPIIGIQILLKNPFEEESTDNSKSDFYQPLVLLVQSEEGYKNLLKLSSQSYTLPENSSSPYITIEQLSQYNNGLICLSGGFHGPLAYLIKKNKTEACFNLTKKLHAIFQDRFYLELTRHGYEEEKTVELNILNIAEQLKIPIVATNDVFFQSPDVYKAQDALICVSEGTYVSVDERRHLTTEHYFKTPQQMVELFSDIPAAVENTVHIAKRCHYFPKPHKPILPPFTTASNLPEKEELEQQAYQGLEKRLKEQVLPPDIYADEKEKIEKKYKDRLAYELSVIISMGFSGYFLIVSDFIKWAKNNSIPVGPGRGSGASSLTAWCLDITDIDPLRFQLIFERFLNPERVSMPDFDVDFCQEKRDEVINYVRQKYGKDKVAQIITYGKLQARAVLRDVGRVLQMPYTQVDRICKLVPNNPAHPLTLAEALKVEPKLALECKNEEMVAELISIGLQLEGLYRHASIHAAGIVIGDRPLDELVPMYRDPKSPMLVTQFNMKFAEKAGLVKFDFLGLKTLTVIEKAVQMVRKKINPNFSINTISLEDKATFELLCRVDTVGIFQLESAGMSDVLRQLQPEKFDELIALVALYRPGPMDDIPRYIACRHGREPVTYMHPSLEPVLKESFGVMVYQEQVMWIARELAGYSLGDADLLRRAMGKKIKSEMDLQRKIFIDGAGKNNIEKSLAEEIFDKIAKFASYAFPKAHAAPYALLSYQTAYLKANFPLQFFAASMTLDIHNTDKLNIFRQDMNHLKINLLPPDINLSQPDFSVEGTSIRYALSALKGVGEAAMEEVIQERVSNGPYTSLWDFAARLSNKVINKRQLESLILSGAFDSLHPNRHSLFKNVETFLNYGIEARAKSSSNQDSLFEETELPSHPGIKEEPNWPLLIKLEKEFSALGLYLSAHPLDAYNLALPYLKHKKYIDVLQNLKNKQEETTVSMIGVIIGRNDKVSRKGNSFSFIQLSDQTGVFEATVFSDVLRENSDTLVPGKSVSVEITARWENDSEAPRFSISSAQDLDELCEKSIRNIAFDISSLDELKKYKDRLEKCENGGAKIIFNIVANLDNNLIKEFRFSLSLPGRYRLKEYS